MGRKDSTVNQAEILGQIRNLMSKTDVEYTEEQLEKLATLVVLLCKWNTALNLTLLENLKRLLFFIFWIVLLFHLESRKKIILQMWEQVQGFLV